MMHYIIQVMNDISEMQSLREEKKEELRKKWHETKSMPRKMKKKIRKELRLDAIILSYDPLEGLRLIHEKSTN